MMAYEGYKYITNQVVREGLYPVRKLFEALNRKKRLSIAYVDEQGLLKLKGKAVDRWSQLPPWPTPQQ